ncbi:MAG TPA: ferrochelatase [Planctomycetaceae bacterium]|jgi:ferrochelatase|nr:ferrochelatase [Planctomycetaceae bacterium]
MTTALPPYDALLLVSFGGPERREDVIPFLENVLRGKPVPRERMLEVAEHYYHFDGVSPINAQCRELLAALRAELDASGFTLPLYWGNRNWHPLLTETLREMTAKGHRRVLAIFTSAYSSYSGCRQYRENIGAAQTEVGPDAPAVDKLRVFYNHPQFVAANVDRIRTALAKLPDDGRDQATLLFTAHSIPLSMANHCDYVKQLEETRRLITEQLAHAADRSQLVYQSRSGRPQDPWLEPDVNDALRTLHANGCPAVVICPIGFLSDHMEVLYDLDYESKALCEELGMPMTRAGTVGSHPQFVSCLRDLIDERITGRADKACIGQYGPNHDVCPEATCCLYPMTRPSR